MAVRVVAAVGGVADALIEATKERLPKVRGGPGRDPSAEMGPIITGENRDKVASYLDSGPEQGAELVVDGREHPLYQEGKGFFLGVSLLDRVTPEMDCYRNEVFGPVLEVVRVADYPEAVQLINDNPYG